MDAREAKLIDKSGLDTLQLKWSSKFDDNRNTEVEEEVLNLLEPHKNLERLSIQDYGGSKFPIWINSLQNLSSLTLFGRRNSISLPFVGKLPLLKDLSIRGMDKLSKVGVEFYGENPSNAFTSLQSLNFENMPRWKEWDLVDEQALKFPSLVVLSITNCPQLLGTLPNHLHSLKKLEIRGCAQMVVSLSDLPKQSELRMRECAEFVLKDYAEFPSIKEVRLSNVKKFPTPTDKLVFTSTTLEYCEISSCKGLTYLSLKELGLLGHLRPGSFRKLVISNCPQLVLLEKELCNIDSLIIKECGFSVESLRIRKHLLAFLTEMEIINRPNIISFANNFPPVLKKSKIEKCENLQCLVDGEENMSFSNISPLEHLQIIECPSLISLSLPIMLRYLEMWSCSKLASLSESGQLLISLKKLQLYCCPLLESVAEAIDENACLESIYIYDCGIKSLPQGLDKLNHLQKIEIEGCQNLVSLVGFLPTTKLAELMISYCANLRALPNCMHNFISLRELKLLDLSGDEVSIPEEGISTSLTSLAIAVPRNYESLLQWRFHRLTSLRSLEIYGDGCPNMVKFPPEEIGMMLPSSFNLLSIRNFQSLESLSSQGFQNLTSLHHLRIYNCPKLTSPPEKEMLLSLLELSIFNCPLLDEKCKRNKGREWSKIAHIPSVNLGLF